MAAPQQRGRQGAEPLRRYRELRLPGTQRVGPICLDLLSLPYLPRLTLHEVLILGKDLDVLFLAVGQLFVEVQVVDPLLERKDGIVPPLRGGCPSVVDRIPGQRSIDYIIELRGTKHREVNLVFAGNAIPHVPLHAGQRKDNIVLSGNQGKDAGFIEVNSGVQKVGGQIFAHIADAANYHGWCPFQYLPGRVLRTASVLDLEQNVLLRFVDGRPVSAITTQFLADRCVSVENPQSRRRHRSRTKYRRRPSSTP